MFKKLRIKGKLLFSFLLIGIIPLVVAGSISLLIAKSSLEEQAFNLLEAQRNIKAKQIEMFFSERKSDALVLASNPTTVQAMLDLNDAFDSGGGVKGGNFKGYTGERFEAPEKYKIVHQKYFDTFKYYMEQYGYYDLFLMTPDTGDIIFTVTKEPDFATSAIEVESSLQYVWNKAIRNNNASVSDTKPYSPSNGVPAQFIAAPIMENGKVLGVVALQVSLDSINNIMSERTGMGESGETYLVGQDKLMRSDSFLDPINHSVEASFANPAKGSVNSTTLVDALNGGSGKDIIIDYNGNYVLSSYKTVDIGDNITWAVLSEIDEVEAFANVYHLAYWIIGVIAIAILIIVAIGFLVAIGISRPIISLMSVMRDVKEHADFSQRVNTYSADEVGDAGKAFDGLLESLQHAIAGTNSTLKMVSDGDFSKKIDLDLTGDLDLLKQGINSTVDNMKATMAALYEILEAMADGDFAKRINVDLKGEYKRSADAATESITSLDNAVNAINDVMASVAQADFNSRVEVQLKGDLNTLKQNLNKSLDVVMRGIEDTSRITVALSKGDLTKRVEVNHPGEFGVLTNALNETMENITEVVANIAEAAEVVSSASTEIADGNADMSKRTESQASSLEETASSMEELTSTVKQNAENAGQANQLAINASSVADEGRNVVTDAVQAMEEINNSSNKIADIIGVIDEIAFQTNLLALNASVEAARAGEQGRGFAVVATEVRNLAQRSATAAKEIKDLIQDSVGKVKAGSELVAKSGETLSEIVDGVKKVGDMIAEIAAASEQQNAGISQVNQALASMDEITQQNAALAEEASANSENLNSQAITLNDQVQFFTIENSKKSISKASAPKTAASSSPAPKATPKPKTNAKTSKPEPSDDWEEF